MAAPTLDQLADALRSAGYTIAALGDHVIIADRPIAGHQLEFRSIHFHQLAESLPWFGTCWRKRLAEVVETLDGHAIPNFDYRALHHSGPLRTLEDAEAWLGSVSSVPVSDREVRAIVGLVH